MCIRDSFYFAGVDCLLYDIAVCANDWCLENGGAALDAGRTRALLAACQGVRPFTPLERAAWPAMLRAAPFGWLALLLGYWLLMTLVSVVPLVGVAIASLAVPAFSVGFMAAARAASRRSGVEMALLFDGFRHAQRSQLALGVVYLACLALVLGGSSLADEGALARWMLIGRRPA